MTLENSAHRPIRISETAYMNLISQLSINGSSLDSYAASCFRELIDHFDRGLNRLLDPSYYLSSMPPGYGKTESIVSFVKAWKAAGFNPRGGVLIGLQSKGQISALVKRLELLKSEVGILTSDETINELGCGAIGINDAPVLITTQQMIASRTKARPFEKTSCFFFGGKPRNLRI